MDGADFSRLDFEFLLISFKKLFFPEFDLLNSGCGLSAGAAYLRVFTVFVPTIKICACTSVLRGESSFLLD